MINRIYICTILILLSLSCNGAVDVRSEFSPLPIGFDIKIVSIGVVQSGVLMDMYEVRYSGAAQQAIDYFHSTWNESDTNTSIVNKYGQWTLISKLVGKHNIVLQMKDIDAISSEGYISVAYLESMGRPNDSAVMLPGSVLLSSTESSDALGSAVTSMLSNKASLQDNFNFYLNKMPQEGWAVQASSINSDSAVITFTSKGRQLEVAIGRRGSESVVVYNEVTKGKL